MSFGLAWTNAAAFFTISTGGGAAGVAGRGVGAGVGGGGAGRGWEASLMRRSASSFPAAAERLSASSSIALPNSTSASTLRPWLRRRSPWPTSAAARSFFSAAALSTDDDEENAMIATSTAKTPTPAAIPGAGHAGFTFFWVAASMVSPLSQRERSAANALAEE